MKVSWVPAKPVNEPEVEAGLAVSHQANHFANFGPGWRRLAEEAGPILGLGAGRKVVPVANGALALEALVAALCQREGRQLRFAVQSTTFPCSVQGLLRESLVLDIAPPGSPEGPGPALAELERRADEFDGVVVTNLCGSCVEISLYEEFCSRRGKFLLFDNAATPMSWYRGRNVNDYGLGCVISLHHTKPLGFGEGGLAIVAEEYYQTLLEVINFGYSSANKTRHSPFGMNAKMSDLAAVYCLQWLRRAPEIVEKHEELEELFRQEVENINVKNSERGKILEFLQDRSDKRGAGKTRLSSANIVFFPRGTIARVEPFYEQGIECKKYYAPLAPTPVAEDFYRRVLCFPLHVGMGREEIRMIGEALAAVVKDL